MASTRTYYRTSGGKFAGASKATKVTTGKAGGFANASFRQRVQASRGNARPGRPSGQKASHSKSLGGAAGAKARKFNSPGGGAFGKTRRGLSTRAGGAARAGLGLAAISASRDLSSSVITGRGGGGALIGAVGLGYVGGYQLAKGGIQMVSPSLASAAYGKPTARTKTAARPKIPAGSRVGKNAYARKNAKARAGNAARRKQRALGLR